MPKAIVLLSGGQDSSTVLALAMQTHEVVAVSFDYGQRHRAELDAGARIAAKAGVPRVVIECRALGGLGDSALVSARPLAGSGGYADTAMPEGLPTSFVPGRNLIFLSFAAALAVREGAKNIFTGVCQTDYSGYPDCRESFVRAAEKAVNEAMPSSAGPIKVHAPLMHLSKAETVLLARATPGAWSLLAESLTCYEGLRPGCGVCPACDLRAKGFREAHHDDPAAQP